MGCSGESFGAFRKLPDAIEDRQQVDVGEGEMIADQMAGRRDRFIEKASCWRTIGITASIAARSGFPSGFSARCRRRCRCGSGCGRSTVLTSETHCSVSAASLRIGREDVRGRESCDRASRRWLRTRKVRLRHGAAPASCRADGWRQLRRAQRRLGQHIVDALFLADHAHNAGIGRAQGADDLRFRHDLAPRLAAGTWRPPRCRGRPLPCRED